MPSAQTRPAASSKRAANSRGSLYGSGPGHCPGPANIDRFTVEQSPGDRPARCASHGGLRANFQTPANNRPTFLFRLLPNPGLPSTTGRVWPRNQFPRQLLPLSFSLERPQSRRSVSPGAASRLAYHGVDTGRLRRYNSLDHGVRIRRV